MSYRKEVPSVKNDQRIFRNTASKSKSVNLGNFVMRGGIRF